MLMAPFFPTAGVLPNMEKYSIAGLVAGVVADWCAALVLKRKS